MTVFNAHLMEPYLIHKSHSLVLRPTWSHQSSFRISIIRGHFILPGTVHRQQYIELFLILLTPNLYQLLHCCC